MVMVVFYGVAVMVMEVGWWWLVLNKILLKMNKKEL